jgi:hypothetical protein
MNPDLLAVIEPIVAFGQVVVVTDPFLVSEVSRAAPVFYDKPHFGYSCFSQVTQHLLPQSFL